MPGVAKLRRVQVLFFAIRMGIGARESRSRES